MNIPISDEMISAAAEEMYDIGLVEFTYDVAKLKEMVRSILERAVAARYGVQTFSVKFEPPYPTIRIAGW